MRQHFQEWGFEITSSSAFSKPLGKFFRRKDKFRTERITPSTAGFKTRTKSKLNSMWSEAFFGFKEKGVLFLYSQV